jgi:hypothetical protein
MLKSFKGISLKSGALPVEAAAFLLLAACTSGPLNFGSHQA